MIVGLCQCKTKLSKKIFFFLKDALIENKQDFDYNHRSNQYFYTAACACYTKTRRGCRLTQRKRLASSLFSSHPSCEAVWRMSEVVGVGGRRKKEVASVPLFQSFHPRDAFPHLGHLPKVLHSPEKSGDAAPVTSLCYKIREIHHEIPDALIKAIELNVTNSASRYKKKRNNKNRWMFTFSMISKVNVIICGALERTRARRTLK